MANENSLDEDANQNFEEILSLQTERHYVLRLYIAGTSPQSIQAVQNLNKICEEHLQGHYQLEVIDIYQQSELVSMENIVAIPTLIKKLPLPLQRLIGNMSNTEKVLVGLDIRAKENEI